MKEEAMILVEVTLAMYFITSYVVAYRVTRKKYEPNGSNKDKNERITYLKTAFSYNLINAVMIGIINYNMYDWLAKKQVEKISHLLIFLFCILGSIWVIIGIGILICILIQYPKKTFLACMKQEINRTVWQKVAVLKFATVASIICVGLFYILHNLVYLSNCYFISTGATIVNFILLTFPLNEKVKNIKIME